MCLGTCSEIFFIFPKEDSILLRKVSKVSLFIYKELPADCLHCFNFFTISIRIEYLKLNSEAVSANSNIMKPIYLTSGCPKNQKRC